MCGVILTQILPFADQQVLALYYAFETAVYPQYSRRRRSACTWCCCASTDYVSSDAMLQALINV